MTLYVVPTGSLALGWLLGRVTIAKVIIIIQTPPPKTQPKNVGHMEVSSTKSGIIFHLLGMCDSAR